MQFRISKGLTGKLTLHFACPQCEEQLTSPLKEAGTENECPGCGALFTVPGHKEKERLHDAAMAHAAKENATRQKDVVFRLRSIVPDIPSRASGSGFCLLITLFWSIVACALSGFLLLKLGPLFLRVLLD